MDLNEPNLKKLPFQATVIAGAAKQPTATLTDCHMGLLRCSCNESAFFGDFCGCCSVGDQNFAKAGKNQEAPSMPPNSE